MGLAHWISLWLLQAAFTDTVAVENEPRAPEADYAVLDGCNGALGATRCSPAGAAPVDGTAPDWFARVRWDADGRRARVEFRRGDASGDVVETREVEFAPADNDGQRRKAVGLIIAAFVVDQARARAEAASPPPEPPPLPPPQPDPGSQPAGARPQSGSGSESGAESDRGPLIEIGPDLVPPPRPPTWALDLGLLAGPGFERGGPRVGLLVRGMIWPLPVPFAGTASLRGAQRFAEPSVRWLSGTLGAAWLVVPQLTTVGLELRAEAALQNVRVEAEPPAGEGDDSASGNAWRFGGIAGADAWLQLGAGVALVAGVELALLRPKVHLDIGGEAAGIDPALSWVGILGVRTAH